MASFASRSAFRTATRISLALKPRASPPFRISSQNPLRPRICRSPVEMRCVSAALMLPYHTATASALLTSMLSLAPRTNAWIIEAWREKVEKSSQVPGEVDPEAKHLHILNSSFSMVASEVDVATEYSKSWMASVCGRRRDMEDIVVVRPLFPIQIIISPVGCIFSASTMAMAARMCSLCSYLDNSSYF